MTRIDNRQYVLTCSPPSFRRCFLAARILAVDFGEPLAEYGFLGVAARRSPFHVVETLLLPGQQVTPASVHQSGRNVLRLRDEIQRLADARGMPLVPVLFVHRHPGDCRPSQTDRDFATGVFIAHVASALTFTETRVPQPAEPNGHLVRACGPEPGTTRSGGACDSAEIEYAIGFTMIVNAHGEYNIEAVRKEWCLACNASRVTCAPARLRLEPDRPLSPPEIAVLREELAREIAEKVRIRDAFAGPLRRVKHASC